MERGWFSMSTYVTLAEVNNYDRDALLTPTQNQLDEAEEQFISNIIKDREMTTSDIETPVAHEVKMYIISYTFLLCAKFGVDVNITIVPETGYVVDPYRNKVEQYEKEVEKWSKKLTYEVISKTDEDCNAMARIATPKIVRA